jgi:type I restriction enzyme R subunit
MGKLSELKGVEKPVTEWLTKMGWTFKSNEDLKVYNRTFSNPVLEEILIEKTALINNIDEEAAKIAVERLMLNLNNPSPILGNEKSVSSRERYIAICRG